MCPMLLNRISDGPVIGLPPSQEHAFAQFPSQSLLDTPNGLHGCSPSSNTTFVGNGSTSAAHGAGNTAAPVPSKPSRKRSRDEASFEEATTSTPPVPKPAPAPKWEPIYGEGMVLLNPQTGLAVSAESQTGTWYEESAEAQAAAKPPVSSRSMELESDAAELSRKSQRLDVSAPGLDDIALSSIQQRLNGSEMADQHRTLNGGSTPPHEPLIDDATRLLGISWQRIDNEGDMAPAIRGWTKYIDNEFGAYLHGSQMLLKCRALNAFLVAATPVSSMSPAFYLFNEDLTQAQLVASSWDACVQNLRHNPIVFEGAAPIAAASQSKTLSATPFTTADSGVPLLQQALAGQPNVPGTGLNGGVDTGMEIDS
ncbi:hypothetical protein N7468_004601 [Penicillium chermesinum]|uniref:Uncharacterized protein n=1 Tax=Penicillium chermesinum TaxID=63820 RepID=A0A9W9PBQ9_9EURO|nr:uncharacterized protein N7468_004601 [Penicillium chermesinum]KAJ5239982.1 hypothetical protein N7468_004601 [Penicillium chermesinum]